MVEVSIRISVRQRANERCEYCRLPESVGDIPFHVEHIKAKQHLGDDRLENLALACDRCNFYKGTNLTSVDPETKTIVAIFHPRTDAWSDHFELRGAEILGKTPTGRATVRLLHMNCARRVAMRAELIKRGESL